MSNTYRLVNPHIEGDFSSKVKAQNSAVAAKSFYKNLSQHFNNNIPKFYFTIQKGGSGSGKYYHFVVKEVKNKDQVKFKIEPHVIANDASSIQSFESKLNNFKTKFEQAGGKAKKYSNKGSKKGSKKSKKVDDSSDSDDSDSDTESFYRKAQTYKPLVVPPLYYWWYDPSVYNLSSVFLPTFYSYTCPYLQICL